ncbi:MAG TPA: 8-amino-7-oxononanoate synthase [Solirubrobacterales bacterium]|nr:8-amino-7-oxononanoate synthase [Solirubrobacterales bacterium]
MTRPAAAEQVDELRRAGLHRRMRLIEGAQGPRVSLDGRDVLLLCSNNSLGLAEHPEVRLAGAEAYRDICASAGASRLVSGNMDVHERLEGRLASFHRQEAALLFGSGYLANTGTIAALARRGEVVYSDALNHASIVDGCRLAGAETFIYRHRDVEHLGWALKRADRPAALIVSDGLFSMDGDVAPLAWLVELARRHDARLMIDEAHAVGTFGPSGQGTIAAAGLSDEVDVTSGTLGKSLGSYGAYVATSAELRDLLVNRARPLIFSTGLPPAVAAAAEAALGIIEREPHRVEQLRENGETLRSALAAEGLEGIAGEGADPGTQIIPLVIGDPERAVAACARALEQGVYAQAIRPPTVPEGTSRLRMTVMASHEPEDLRRAASVIAAAVRAVAADGEYSIEIPEPEGEPEVYRVAPEPASRAPRS